MPDASSDKDSGRQHRIRAVARSAVRVTPKRPYYEWLASMVPEPDPGVDHAAEYEKSDVSGAHIYLIPYFAEEFDSEMFVAEHYDLMFDQILDCAAHEKDWPSPRTFEMFTEWFDVAHHLFVDDLGHGPYELNENDSMLGIEAPRDSDPDTTIGDDNPDVTL